MADGRKGNSLLWIILVAVVIFAILWATDIIDFAAKGDLEAPDVDVSVEGGEVPNIDADVADIDVGTETKNVTVEVPDVDIEGATPDEE
ncbi:hypothetical protein [Sphingomicrobium nitratireducens]|uniref:hypothetical protein n=1 Tax=Sphingomicrobium nitratireducens TaxID=2964666 RepID=UPI00223EE2C6|nr:hypothetical protein [Sphingomicrobium nitratireducens]